VEVTKRKELAQEFLRQVGVTFPVAEDRADVATRYGVEGTPTNFLIDPKGRILFRRVGFGPGSELELGAQVEYLLARARTPS
jgi:hypothetical protein